MSAGLFVWIAIILAGVVLLMCALFEIDQRVWRRCGCGCDSFDESEPARICRNCGVPW